MVYNGTNGKTSVSTGKRTTTTSLDRIKLVTMMVICTIVYYDQGNYYSQNYDASN